MRALGPAREQVELWLDTKGGKFFWQNLGFRALRHTLTVRGQGIKES